MFDMLEKINTRPKPFECYTAEDLWTDEYTAKQMLAFHLDPSVDISSRKAAFIEQSVAWIASEFNVGRGTKIADFGCGPGLYTTRLAELGAELTGIDFSSSSLHYAKCVAAEKGLPIHYEKQNYLEYETGERFDLIMMIMCDFCALSPEQRSVLLTKFHQLLAPGGAILLDVYSLAAYSKREEKAEYAINSLHGFWSANKYYGFLNTFKYDDERIVLDKYSLFEANREDRTVYNWLQYFTLDAIEKEFAACGLNIEKVLGSVAGVEFDPQGDEFAIIARRA